MKKWLSYFWYIPSEEERNLRLKITKLEDQLDIANRRIEFLTQVNELQLQQVMTATAAVVQLGLFNGAAEQVAPDTQNREYRIAK